jgi:DNA-3-methyladenine glycosylase II
MRTFQYGEAELAYLKQRDPALAAVIDLVGPIEREVIPDLFAALIHAIASQQVSSRAAASVWAKLQACLGEITPERVIAVPPGDLRGCGLSARKAEYVRDVASAVLRGDLNLAELRELPDEEVIGRLASLRGVGRWTAEMLLIFSMERPDVVSWGDLAIRRGMMALYGLATLDRHQFDRYRKRYSPYGSVASLYLWAVAHDPALAPGA